MKLQPLAQVMPNRLGIEAPYEEPIEIEIRTLGDYRPINGLVSFSADGVSDPVTMTVYTGLDQSKGRYIIDGQNQEPPRG